MSRLDEIYAQVPEIDCQGWCHESCGPLVLTDAERQRITDRHGVTIPDLVRWTCPALTAFGRCQVHADRPLLCRMWGVVESMPCPFGCRPPRVLSDAEGHRLLAELRAGGGA